MYPKILLKDVNSMAHIIELMTRGGRRSKINGFCDDVVYVRPLVAPKITRLLIQKSSLSSIFNKAEKFPIKPTTQDPLFGPV